MRSNLQSISLFSALEAAFVILVILLLEPGELVDILRREAPSIEEVDLLERAIWLGIYAVTLLLLALRFSRSLYLLVRDKFLLLLVGMAILSVFWSFAPEVTLRRGFLLLGTILFAVYLTARFSLSEQMRLLAWALGISAILSLLLALAFPTYGLMDSGEWQGIYRHKNALGRMMTLASIVFLFRAVSNYRHRLINYAGFGLSASLILLSNSKGAWAIFLTIMALLPLYYAVRWHYTLAVPFFIVMIFVGGIALTWLLSNAEPVLSSLGKDVTLSGRSEIWTAVFDKIRERPWIGYGYNGFWLEWEGESAYVWSVLPGEFFPAHSHNGYLDLWLDLGLLGLLIFISGLLFSLIKSIQVARSTAAIATLWPPIYLTYMLLSNVVESSILKPNDVWWILYVAAVLSIYIERDRLASRPSFNPPRRESLTPDA